MKSIAISGSPRENVGKRDAKELRYQGQVPAVLYGGEKQYHFSVSASGLKSLVYTPDVHFVDLDIAGEKHQAIVQEIQFHPLTDQIRHVDFLELDDKKEVAMKIPVKLTGVSPGVKTGGKLIQKLRELRVKALPKDLPQYIEISLNALEVGKSVRVEEVKIDKVKVLNNSDDTIVSVVMSRALRQAEQEAAKGA